MNVSPANGGTIEVNQKAPASYPAILPFSSGGHAQLAATAASGYEFINWSDDISSTVNPIDIVMDCNKKITANFTRIIHTLNIQVKGNGSVTPEPGNHSYGDGDKVAITATPGDGWQFDGWTDDVSDMSTPTITVVIDSDKTITANFSQTGPNIWWIVGAAIVGIAIIGFTIWLIIAQRRD